MVCGSSVTWCSNTLSSTCIPILHCPAKLWASLFTSHCSSLLRCMNEYLAIDSGRYLHFIRNGVHLNRSARDSKDWKLGYMSGCHLHFTSSLRHIIPSSHHPFVTSSLRHIIPSSHHPFVTSSLRHIIPSSHHPFVTSSLRHIIPSSHHPFVTSSLRHIIPSSHHPFVTSSLRHIIPSSHHPFVTMVVEWHFHEKATPNWFVFYCGAICLS